ncbi:MAG: hypothetical protein WCL54_08365 [Clostridia bacterium]
MGIDRLILTCLSFVLMIFLVVVAVEMVIPITKSQLFHEECRTYLLKMERNGGFLEEDSQALAQRLQSLGINVTSISAPLRGSVKFGETMTLSVEAGYPFRLGAAGLTFVSQLQPFKYKKSVFCRRIEIG